MKEYFVSVLLQGGGSVMVRRRAGSHEDAVTKVLLGPYGQIAVCAFSYVGQSGRVAHAVWRLKRTVLAA